MLRCLAAALRAFALLVALALLGPPALSGPALAHEGHDHGAEAPPAPAATAPRAEAVSERFELVAVVQGTHLVLYLDAFASNAPVPEASVAVMTPEGRRRAAETAPGTYRLAAPWLAAGGDHDLIVGVSVEGRTDILNLDLHLPAPVATPAAGPSTPGTAAMALVGHLARKNPAA
ncbi:RND transporter, partial [Methylobacterium goesingense]